MFHGRSRSTSGSPQRRDLAHRHFARVSPANDGVIFCCFSPHSLPLPSLVGLHPLHPPPSFSLRLSPPFRRTFTPDSAMDSRPLLSFSPFRENCSSPSILPLALAPSYPQPLDNDRYRLAAAYIRNPARIHASVPAASCKGRGAIDETRSAGTGRKEDVLVPQSHRKIRDTLFA